MHLHIQRIRACFLAMAVGVLARVVSPAAPVRISFLGPDPSLTNTCELLKSSSVTHEAVARFEAAVRNYYSTGFYGTASDHDFTKFPPPKNGFCTFSNITDLVEALPYRLWKTKHTYNLNCFDTVILLSNNHLRSRLKPDERAGKFIVTSPTTNDLPVVIEVATAREAFTKTYATWYREATDRLFPKTLQDRRVALTAALFRYHSLPNVVKKEPLGKSVLDALRKDWRLQKLTFPRSFELVLCHKIYTPYRIFATTHTGLLFRQDKGYGYLEKAGGCGPFLRLDFEDRADLLAWIAAEFEGLDDEHTQVFVTFNDVTIEKLDIVR